MAKIELRKQWKNRVEEFKNSSQSINEWCRTNNLKPSTFRYWLNKEKTKYTVSKNIVKVLSALC